MQSSSHRRPEAIRHATTCVRMRTTALTLLAALSMTNLSILHLAHGAPIGAVARPDPAIETITAAARAAQQRCYEFMHEDADEFVSCIDALDHAVPHGTKQTAYRHLGISYFGWVGANNSARVSLPGADAAASRFFVRYQSQRRRLQIDESRLCAVVAGDCTARLAQIAAAHRAVRVGRAPR